VLADLGSRGVAAPLVIVPCNANVETVHGETDSRRATDP
jgi:hypothetical protein